MIKNERQYRITKAQAQKFAQALAEMQANPAENNALHPLLQNAERDALHSQWESLQAELSEYEALSAGPPQSFQLDSFDDLPRTLIKARIAAGLSQSELAGRLGLKEQQIQRYEATEYASASLSRVSAIIRALNIRVQENIFLTSQ